MTFTASSDQSLLVSLGEGISRPVNLQVHRLLAAIDQSGVQAVTGLSPGYNSLLIRFDARRTRHEELEQQVRELFGTLAQSEPASGQVAWVEIPVIYDGPDLDELAARSSLSPREVVETHASVTYHCYFLGFVPGFAYLGDVPDAIAAPRRASPRKQVPAGSVGIAGNQTGVYPVASPGGWNLIGRTTARMFDAERGVPLIRPGDQVRFVPSAKGPAS